MRSIATVFLQLLLVLALGSTLLLAPEALSAPLDEITNLQTPEVLRQPSHQTELLWQYGGALTAVNAQGNLAFVGIGQRLMVLDISNPGEALLIGQTGQLIGRLSDIEVQGDNVYATIPGFLQGAQIVGGALLVIDISDLTQPQQVAILETPGGAHGLEVDGTYAYVADGEDGITLIDISDPAQPAYADTLLNESVFHLELAGDYLYIAAEDAGLIVLEVVDPLSPVQKFQYIDPISGGEVEEVFLTGSRLYANERGAVHIFSLADPALPDYLDSLRAPDIITYVEFTAGYGNYLYLFDYYEGLQIVDATDPADPGLVDTIPELKEMFFYGKPEVEGEQLFIPASEDGLLIYLLSTPVAPQLQKTFHVDGSASHVLLDGPLAYLGSTPQGTGKLTVLDLSNRDQFVQLGMVKTIGRLEAVIDGYAYFFEQFINDQYAWQYDLNIYDARNPAQIGFLKTIDLESYGGELFDIVVLDNFAYAIIGSSLQIFDVSDPANPAARGNLPGVENGVALAIAPGASDSGRLLAYVASTSSDHDLQILDVSDPMAPTAISTFATPQNSSKDIAVEGDYAYLLFDATILAKIDIRDPELPLYIPETGSSTGFGSGESVMLAGDYAYLAYGYDGLEVKDLAGLGTRAFYRTPTSVGELAVTDTFALLAAGPAGFYFVWAGPESSAQIPAASGGTLISLYDGTQVGFSAGAFSEDTSVYHWPRYLPLVPQPDPPSQLIGPAFQLIAANNLQTQLPYTLMVPLGSVDGLDIIETSPALYWWEGNNWLPLANSNLDLQNGLVTAEASQLGTFAIIGELQVQQACYLPIIAR